MRRRARREREERLTLAYDTGALTGAAMAGKLETLAHYLEAIRPKPKRSILAKLRDAVLRGAPMKISKSERS